jgi:hypothetical protein
LVKKYDDLSEEIIVPDDVLKEEEFLDLENFNKRDVRKTQFSEQDKITKFFSQVDYNHMAL